MRIFITLLATLFATFASAKEDYGNVEYLDGWRLPDGSYQTAIVFNLEDGWKTYWRVPGPAGLPTTFNWTGSRNISDVVIDWPAPYVFESYGLYSFGYKGQVVLPVRIVPADPDKPVSVDMRMEFGVCSDICVPANARLQAALDSNTAPEGKPLIAKALTKTALPLGKGGVSSVNCDLRPNPKGMDISARLQFSGTPASEQYVVMEYDNPDIWIDSAELQREGRAVTASSRLEFYGSGILALDRSKLRVTLLQGGKAYETTGCPAR